MFKPAEIKSFLLKIIDFFYPLAKRWIGIQTFRYAVCGGSNAFLNLLTFYLSYNFIFLNNVVYFSGYPITRYIAAYIVASSISFPVGFLLNRYIVFQESNLKASTQLIRYLSITLSSIAIDYFLLHLLIGYFHFWATASQALIIVILSLYSYFFQTYFSFRTKST